MDAEQLKDQQEPARVQGPTMSSAYTRLSSEKGDSWTVTKSTPRGITKNAEVALRKCSVGLGFVEVSSCTRSSDAEQEPLSKMK